MIFYPRASQSGGFSNFLLRAFHDLNIEPNVVQTVDDVVTAVAFVSSGVGLAAAVESARTLQLPDVVYVPLAVAIFTLPSLFSNLWQGLRFRPARVGPALTWGL